MIEVESIKVQSPLCLTLAMLHGGAIRQGCATAGYEAEFDEVVTKLCPEVFPRRAVAPLVTALAIGVGLPGMRWALAAPDQDATPAG